MAGSVKEKYLFRLRSNDRINNYSSKRVPTYSKSKTQFGCKSKWKSSSESVGSLTNSNDILSFSGGEATSESEFEEHPYSVPKKPKICLPDSLYCENESRTRSIAKMNNSTMNFKVNEAFRTIKKEVDQGRTNTRRARQSKCESKNAIMARLNRLKKKKYISDLEDKNVKLEAENESLKEMLRKRLAEVLSLKRETLNLHSVIKNSTEIGSLLQCVLKNTNLHVTSSLLRNKPDQEEQLLPCIAVGPSSAPCSSPVIEKLATENEGRLDDAKFLKTSNPSSTLNNTISLSSGNSLIDNGQNEHFEFDLCDDLLSDLKPDASPCNLFHNIETSHSLDSNEFLRCETPSKDFDISFSNNDALFDDVGVCFHVANNTVSLEFCESCNRKALSYLISDQSVD